MSYALTIGIPTFNRAEAVSAAVRCALDCTANLSVEILVSDNASPDDTLDRLQEYESHLRFSLIRGQENVGWSGNIMRLANAATAPYLLIISDEDNVVDEQQLAELIKFLTQKKPKLAAACVGRTQGSNVVDANSFWSITSDLPGLIIEIESLRAALGRIKQYEYPERIEEIWQTYPQVIIALDLWLQGHTFLAFGKPFRQQRVDLPTQWNPAPLIRGSLPALVKHSGLPVGAKHYKHLLSRLAQQEGLAVWVQHLVMELGLPVDRNRLKSFNYWQANYVSRKLLGQISDVYPTIYPSLQLGLRRELNYMRKFAALRQKMQQKTKYEIRRLFSW